MRSSCRVTTTGSEGTPDIKSDYLAQHSTKSRTVGVEGTELSEASKWRIQKVGAGTNELPLGLKTNDGGDDYYYATLYMPFDVLLPANATASIIYRWTNTSAYSRSISYYNTAGNSCPSDYMGSNRFVPAGTPVIVRTTDKTGSIEITIPTTSPSTTTANAVANDNVLSGSYLEQLLSSGNTYFTFGLPITFTSPNINAETGVVTGSSPSTASSGVGFFKNANRNRESDVRSANWTRNNWYVYANKAYYCASGSLAREKTRGVDFVPVIFDDEGGEDPDIKDNSDRIVGDGCVYDLQGRKVATKQQVEDDTWRQFLRPGIYIINGKKIRL